MELDGTEADASAGSGEGMAVQVAPMADIPLHTLCWGAQGSGQAVQVGLHTLYTLYNITGQYQAVRRAPVAHVGLDTPCSLYMTK